MNIFKFLVTTAVTIVGIWQLTIQIPTSGGTLPPLGKFLNPFHGFWQNAIDRESGPLKTASLPGLTDAVTVSYDKHLVPHIYANNEADAYYVQGYLTARHRLWQMEFQTHAAAGRISEIVGDRALPLDREKRRMGLTIGAENALNYLSADSTSNRIIEAYCAGVNDYISGLKKKHYPVEYKLLDYKPEAWKPLKTALLLTYMANILSSNENDIENTNFIGAFGDTLFRQLYRNFYDAQDPIIPKSVQWEWDDMTHEEGPNDPADRSISGLRHSKPATIIGSNNWALAGSRTATGKPMLANDPHLRLTLPSIWFQMHMVTPETNVYGVTFPGSPCIIIGFNEQVAWGVTNSGRDVRDWYEIKFSDSSKSHYLYDGKMVSTTTRKEVYRVRGGADFTETIYMTHHGPVVYDEGYPLDGNAANLALQWTAHQPSSELLTFHYLNRAKNYSDYINALEYYQAPAQNFVFASRDGDIAIKQQGRFPYYEDDRGRFIKDGSDPANDWNRFIPAGHNPHVKNPERGFVSSANQHPTDSTYPYNYSGVFEYYRGRRLNALLNKSQEATAVDHMNWQLDNYNLQAAESLPIFLKYLDRAGLNEQETMVVEDLSSWNYMNERGLTAPSYYESWWNAFNQLLWDEIAEAPGIMVVPHKFATIHVLANNPGHPFFDMVKTTEIETVETIVTRSFKQAINELEQQSAIEGAPPLWWKTKATEINHLARISAFSRKDVECDGNKGILNATGKYWGPSWRMIVDLEDGMKAVGIYPGGQSGTPGNPYYDNFINDWSNGIYYPLLFDKQPAVDSDRYLYTQKLVPPSS